MEGYKFPILRISLLSSDKGHRHQGMAQLDEGDIYSLAVKFGQLSKVVLNNDKTEAYIFFTSLLNAYICFKLLRALNLGAASKAFGVEWVYHCGYHSDVANEVHRFVNSMKWETPG
jgi:hypothetical protein